MVDAYRRTRRRPAVISIVSFVTLTLLAAHGRGDPLEHVEANERLSTAPNQGTSIGLSLPTGRSDVIADNRPRSEPGFPQSDTRTTAILLRPTSNAPTARSANPMGQSVLTQPAVPWYRSGLGSLGIVLAIIAIVLWCVRRWMPTLRSGGRCPAMSVVGRVGLSPKHTVALISLGRRFVLVGLSGDRMAPICEITDPEEVSELTLRIGTSMSDGKEFDVLLASEANAYENVAEGAEEPATRTRTRSGPSGRKPVSALLARLRTLRLK